MHSRYTVNYHLRAHKRDAFIEFIKSLLLTPFVLHTRPVNQTLLSSPGSQILNSSNSAEVPTSFTAEVSESVNKNVARYTEILSCVEDLIADHIIFQNSNIKELSRLSQLVPSVGTFFTSLSLKESFLINDKKRSLSSRTFVPPSFNDIRHILNTAQVYAIAAHIRLITFDGDMTLYADGANFSRDSALVGLIIKLLGLGLKVAIVTAAAYGEEYLRYEQRLTGLLEGILQTTTLNDDERGNFFVMGGECNYLFRLNPKAKHLVYIDSESYQPPHVKKWSSDKVKVKELVDVAHVCIEETIKRLDVAERVTIIRKEKAVGIICNSGTGKLSREQLDEFALSIQQRLNNFQHVKSLRYAQSPNDLTVLTGKSVNLRDAEEYEAIPFCAFNGGNDVFMDIGNKLIGVSILQGFFGAEGHQTLHVGDQFLSTGNDIATRSACCTTWITSPEETQEVLIDLVEQIKLNKVKA